MADFLLELRSEEIPARMQAKARNDLARMFAEELDKAGLEAGAIETHSTPRRLVLMARDVASETAASREEIKGPKSAAPAQALEGFLRKTGLTRDQLEERDGVLFAVIERPGRTAAEVIGGALAKIIANFPWPKSMRWGDGTLRWVRPLHGIIALLGDTIVPVAIDGIHSGASTVGHRFHHPGAITIGGAGDYIEKLRACHVIVDQDERERLIREGAEQAAVDAGLKIIADEGLVVENAGLTEWPVPLLGRFDGDYLDVPREVIVLTMRTNQKYFACTGDDGGLAPAFVCVANVDANDGGEAIIEGNRRVLAARLADARFFWEQDLKVPLEEQAKKLDGIIFHDKLGTVADKVERVAKLASWLCEEGVVPPPAHMSKEELTHAARTAAGLCKADLVTGLVGEFPELQGIIGGQLAHCQGHAQDISDAVRDHYKPVGQGDDVPTAPVTVAIALADKLDSLASFFAEQMFPTGSKDPFALRRAALGAIGLIRSNRLNVEIGELIRKGWSTSTSGSLGEVVIDFFIERLKVALKDEGVRHDLIAASTDWNGKFDGRLDRVERRANALQSFVETGEGRDLLAAYKRAANILKKEKWEDKQTPNQVRGDGLEPAEQALIAALSQAESKAAAAVEAEDFTGAMAALASLRQPIDVFFDQVAVNDPDADTRARRLNLLRRFRDAVHRVADFSKIEG
ncbi:glycine--tRNA ligase subunit beta [Sphingomonas sp.]|uniref:glycine--tRNA ligase subunit beta n=1 Tax=Sphingomonas sp. TaxID=28214 RepID=UPI002869FB00|nr:glycine--tRNA ligase subunit beta [Sphingomonas sp.]